MQSRLLRTFGVVLLLLAVSPVTAPFSTCDLNQLFGAPTSTGTASLHAKAAADEPVAWTGSLAAPSAQLSLFTRSAGDGPDGLLVRAALRLQLRV
jgi:hypothetical protein